ncbi:TetR/AcrR family transcriptional regulator [Agromyces sp. MMS24-JH15]|uniref:TetR/AcrR family transcriptional regulator n=1 Tax=Agromyces sp. MMS24-JH15 TaxID=3243765 RepID=UPI003749F98A
MTELREPTERAYHHGNLRSDLLDRAWDAVDRGGVESLSLRGLARDAGVSHGASARHFRDRQALLDALAITGFDRLNEALADAVSGAGPAAAPDASPGADAFEARLRAAGLAYIGFAVAHPAILDLMYSAKHHPAASAELVELGHAGMSALVGLLADAQAQGAVRDGDAARHALVAFAAVHGVATLATDDLLDGVDWRDAANETISFVWRGLASPAA